MNGMILMNHINVCMISESSQYLDTLCASEYRSDFPGAVTNQIP